MSWEEEFMQNNIEDEYDDFSIDDEFCLDDDEDGYITVEEWIAAAEDPEPVEENDPHNAGDYYREKREREMREMMAYEEYQWAEAESMASIHGGDPEYWYNKMNGI